MGNKPSLLLVANYKNTTGYAWTNIYRLFDSIAKEFSGLGWRVIVSFSKIEGEVKIFDPGLDLEFIEYDPNDRSLGNTIQLLRIINEHSIKCVYLTDQSSLDYRYSLIRLIGAKKVVVHNRISVADPNPTNYDDSFKAFLKSLLSKSKFIAPDKIYAVSDFVKNRLINKNRFPSRRIVKIMNGIDVDSFKIDDCMNHKGSESALSIFLGARATSYKGVQVLIEATALLQNRVTIPFEVRYAGDGPELDRFKKMVQHYNLQRQVKFLGELGSTKGEVLAADIIVVPSIWGDACPSSVSEALASGRPLVASSVGGVPEMIGDEECAVLVPPGDPEKLANALEKLISSKDLRYSMGKKARVRAESYLNQSRYHKAVLNELKKDFSL